MYVTFSVLYMDVCCKDYESSNPLLFVCTLPCVRSIWDWNISLSVIMWPPSATPFLYPFPLYGEASNHWYFCFLNNIPFLFWEEENQRQIVALFILWNFLMVGTKFILLSSSVPLENPDFRIYPRAKNLDEYSQKVILHAGDALFIPEGW